VNSPFRNREEREREREKRDSLQLILYRSAPSLDPKKETLK
jgi:hypothetical protein